MSLTLSSCHWGFKNGALSTASASVEVATLLARECSVKMRMSIVSCKGCSSKASTEAEATKDNAVTGLLVAMTHCCRLLMPAQMTSFLL